MSFVSFVAAILLVIALIWTVGSVVPKFDDGNTGPARTCATEPAYC